MNEITIRPVRPGDEETLARIYCESWRSGFADLITEEVMNRYADYDRLVVRYRELLKDSSRHGYLLSVNGKSHCMAFWDVSRDETRPDYAELICIHSLPDNWGKGCGTAMMERIIADVKAAGYKKMMIWMFEENTRALRLYEKFGFRRNGIKKEPLGAVEMMLEREF